MPGSAYHDAVWEQVADPTPLPAGHRRALLALVHRGERVLDLGCGDGACSEAIAAAGAVAIALDVSAVALERARARLPGLDARLLDPGAPLPLADGEVAGVWSSEVIERVLDVAAWLGETRRVLRPGGWLALTTPALTRRALVGAALSPRGPAGLLPSGSDRIRLFTAASLAEAVSEAGFAGVHVETIDGRPRERRTLLARARRP